MYVYSHNQLTIGNETSYHHPGGEISTTLYVHLSQVIMKCNRHELA